MIILKFECSCAFICIYEDNMAVLLQVTSKQHLTLLSHPSVPTTTSLSCARTTACDLQSAKMGTDPVPKINCCSREGEGTAQAARQAVSPKAPEPVCMAGHKACYPPSLSNTPATHFDFEVPYNNKRSQTFQVIFKV